MLNGRSIIMTFLFDWISLLFIGYVFIISSLVILCSDDYMSGDLNIVCFIMLVLIKSILWRVAKHLSCIEDAWCLKVNSNTVAYSCILCLL